jgi:hypothetical protein
VLITENAEMSTIEGRMSREQELNSSCRLWPGAWDNKIDKSIVTLTHLQKGDEKNQK